MTSSNSFLHSYCRNILYLIADVICNAINNHVHLQHKQTKLWFPSFLTAAVVKLVINIIYVFYTVLQLNFNKIVLAISVIRPLNGTVPFLEIVVPIRIHC